MGFRDFIRPMQQMFFMQLLVGYVFIVSGLIVCFLMLLCCIFVWPFNQKLYRKMVMHLAYAHWCQFTFLGQWWSGTDVTMIIENPEDRHYIGKEHTIVVMNHKYDIDWMAAWIAAERYGMLGGTKVYGKSVLKFVPLLGWAWVFTESIFLKRDWDKDKRIISRDLQHIAQYPENYWVTLLLFPEGTRFTESKHVQSMEVARKKGMPELKHHLLPRTKGFVHSIHGVKGKMHSILDLTVGFRDDGAKPTMMNIVNGLPCQAEVYCRRIPLEDVPSETDEECAEWLHQLFREKDEIYDDFARNGRFTKGTRIDLPKRPHDLIAWALWAVTLLVPFVKYIVEVFLSGSFTAKIVVVVLIVLGAVVVRKMIAVSETHRGSEYGVDKKGQ